MKSIKRTKMKDNLISKEIKVISIFSVISVAIVLIINFISLYHISSVHSLAQTIYEHPLKVSNAALHVQKGVIQIHRDMKDVVLSSTPNELKKIIDRVDTEERNVYRYLSVIEKIF